MSDLKSCRWAIACVLVAGLPVSVRAQAVFAENFDTNGSVQPGQMGPSGLVARGWVFRNQSQPLGSGTWTNPSPTGSGIPPQQGTGYLGVESNVAQQGGRISAWAVLPAIPGQSAGQFLRFWVQGRESSSFMADEMMELRYSPSGGTGTGSSATDVGDFTVLLDSHQPRLYIWEAIEATLPGTGRLAIRYTKPPTGGFCYARVDNLTVTPSVPVPPIPAPGQTVHWTAAMSPINVDSNITIPAGGTVIVDPGVRVTVQTGVNFHIAGRLVCAGTPSQHVVFDAPVNTAQFGLTGGDLEATWTDFRVQLGLNVGVWNNEGVAPGDAIFSDCTFGEHAWMHLYTSYTQMERCEFDTQYGPIIASSARLVDVTSNVTMKFSHGIFVLDNVTVTGAQGPSELDGVGFNFTSNAQGCYVQGIHALNNQRAGVFASGADFFIGPGNTIQGNAVALELGGGLLAGSTIPPGGNAHNGIISVGHISPPQFGFSHIADYRWEDLGIPYVVGENQTIAPGSRSWTIEEGVDVLMASNSQISTLEFGRLFVEGRPGAPVTMSPLTPGVPWHSVAIATSGNRMTDVDLSGSLRGVATFLGTYVDLLNSRIHGNEHGAVRGVRARKTIFQGNTVAGMSNINGDIGSGVPDAWGLTNPNIFEGNAAAVRDYYNGAHFTINAEHNWWNSPSGPRSSDNPNGAGELVVGVVDTQPHRTTRPDVTDHPPVVEMSRIDYVEPGNKVTLHWTASDDRGIVSQRVGWRLASDHDRLFNIVATLPPGQRSFEWTPPSVGFGGGPETYVRVFATDTAGQDGYAQIDNYIPDQPRPGTVTMSPDPGGQTFRPQQIIPLTVAWSGFDAFITDGPDIYLELLNDDYTEYMSATYTPGAAPLSEIRIPGVSTDQARLVAVSHGSLNRAKFFFSQPFAIRPDPRLGDAPPQVTLLSPGAGASIPAGGPATISWASSDDDYVRWVKIYVSYDAGRTWQRLADRQPANGSFSWNLAPGTGYADVRVRVAAVDSRFQNTSDTRAVSITAGSGPGTCYANCDASTSAPVLNVADFTCFLQRFAAGESYANCDVSTSPPLLNVADFTCFLQRFAGGCP